MVWRNESARHSLCARGMRTGKKINKKMTDYYIQNHSLKQTSQKFKIPQTRTYLYLKNLDLMRTRSESLTGNLNPFYGKTHTTKTKEHLSNVKRKYKINEKFFSKSTPESSYVLGFWMADGTAREGKYVIFDQNQKEILEKINKAMDSTYIIKQHPTAGKIYYRLAICNKKIYNNLQNTCEFKLPNKTHRIVYPHISSENDRHFIRGLFDGDGSVTLANFSYGIYIRFRINGTKQLLEKVKKKIIENCGIEENRIFIRRDKGIWVLNCGGNKNILKIRSWLYEGADDLYLKRKKKKFDEIAVTSLQKNVNVTGG